MLTDDAIIKLYWERSENAVAESDAKYGSACFSIANRILADRQDAEECVADTWLHAWNAIPPQRPEHLFAFFAKITRNLALNRYKSGKAAKRTGNEAALALAELEECVPGADNTEEHCIQRELTAGINRFLQSLPQRDRNIFIRCYFYVQPVRQIAAHYHIREGSVSMNLTRTRRKLKNYLKSEGLLDESDII